MDMADFQKWLNSGDAGLAVDGQGGPATRAAVLDAFVNLDAPAVTTRQVHFLAAHMGCSYEQLVAVANVESSGSGYDKCGRPKMLFERHKFSKFTGGEHDICSFSNPSAGGYNEDSWEKLTYALCEDIEAAFKSASWGKFQVMGFWFPDMGICSALEMAFNCVRSEYDHYRLFVGYIGLADLLGELRQVSCDPDACRPFAEGYNGPAYEQGGYHEKIAAEMQRLT